MNSRLDRRLEEIEASIRRTGLNRRVAKVIADELTDEELREVGTAIALCRGYTLGSGRNLGGVTDQDLRFAARVIRHRRTHG